MTMGNIPRHTSPTADRGGEGGSHAQALKHRRSRRGPAGFLSGAGRPESSSALDPGGGGGPEPKSKAVPFVWHWRDLRPQAIRAAELVGTEQAERRVLIMANPGLPFRAATNTLTANIQVVMPGEIARAHRHTAAALRLIIESGGVHRGQRPHPHAAR